MKIAVIENQEECLVAAGEKLSSVFELYNEIPVLFLSSGGSALEMLEHIDLRKVPKDFTIGVLDERFSREEGVNNFQKLSETDFFEVVSVRGAKCIDTRLREDDTRDSLCTRFENALVSWVEDYPHGKIVATFGIGKDGHTAGIFPYPESEDFFKITFVDTLRWVVAYDAKNKNELPVRITATIPFLKKVDFGVVFISGQEKIDAKNKIMEDIGDLHETPGRILKEMKDIAIFTTLNN